MTVAIRAVVFDIGGVVVGSPLHGATDLERELNLPAGWIGIAIGARGSTGVWARLERGELRLPYAYQLLNAELNDIPFIREAYSAYLVRRGKKDALPPSYTPPQIDAKHLVGRMMRCAVSPNPYVLDAIRRLRKAGVTVAALTNTLRPPHDELEASHLGISLARTVQLKDEFSYWFDSASLGMRKPEMRFYRHALDAIKCEPAATVFLDDIGVNLKPAQALGVHTILVDTSNVLLALHKLQSLVKDVAELGLPDLPNEARPLSNRL